jgi:uncharacterized membrane protein YphA (DoxX/SURF4 family)
MRIVLWVLQVLLAAMFVWHGLLYMAPPAEMVDLMNSMIAPGFRMFIGAAELLAAVGLILPAATRILPWLTPLAAAGLMIITGSATVFHLSRGETSNAIFTVVLFLLATIVAYMRWKVAPIAPRNATHALG